MLYKRKLKVLGLLIVATLSISACATNNNSDESTNAETVLEPNEPLFTDIFFADPSAHVFDDKLYLYPSHDIESGIAPGNNGEQYAMKDYHVISVDFEKGCTDHGIALKLEDIPWAKQQLWAPDAAYKNNQYYLFFPAKDDAGIFRIGVATSDSPTGPFQAEPKYLEGSYSMDPTVFIDEDDQSYLYFGGIWGGQLQNWATGEYAQSANPPEGSEPALGPMVAKLSEDMLSIEGTPQPISILDKEGNPLLAEDEDRRFFEGVWIHKYKDKYYLSYSTGTTHNIVYATSDKPTGPFVYQGKILDPVTGWTTHHSIVEFNGKWYLFYHDASISEKDHLRSLKFAELSYNEDGTINKVDK